MPAAGLGEWYMFFLSFRSHHYGSEPKRFGAKNHDVIIFGIGEDLVNKCKTFSLCKVFGREKKSKSVVKMLFVLMALANEN